jgi:hypothetical protein
MEPRTHPASFRDPDARVVVHEGRIFRVFNAEGAKRWADFEKTGLPAKLVAEGRMVASTPATLPGIADPVVEHPRLPFVSYAYEWTFGMLRAAGLLQLDLALEALEKGFILKDATPYNVLFAGPRPVQVDTASFEALPDGAPWTAYTQFCRLFLNPLLLTALTGVPHHAILRGRLDGLPAEELSALLPLRKKLRRGVFTDVLLQGWLNKKLANASGAFADAAKAAKVSRAQVRGLLDRLRRTLERITAGPPRSMWSRYEQECSIDAQALAFKDQAVDKALEAAAGKTVWDLGANAGRYSAMAAKKAKVVVSFERDPDACEILYGRALERGLSNVHPVVMDLMDPSPGLGWNGEEREGMSSRGRADFLLCLALIHHLSVGAGLPLAKFFAWLDRSADAGLIEFVPKDDPKVKQLLKWKKDVYPGYTQAVFEAELGRRFKIVARLPLPGNTRVLYSFSRV